MAHNVSNEYKQIIYSGDARNKLKLLFNNVELQDADRYCEKMTIKSRIVPNGGKIFSLNNFISKEVELILHDIDTSTIQDQVSISIGTLVGNTYEYVPIGIFNIQDTPTNDKNKTTIKLRDNSVKFDFNYNAQPLIEENGGSATKLQILQDICTQAGVNCNITSFIGYLDEIGIYDNTVTARKYIADIAEQAGKIATINRNGELIFIDLNNLTTWEIPIEIVEKYESGTKFKVGKVVYEDGIVRYETEDSNDDTLFLDGSNNYINGELIKEQANSSDDSYYLENTSENELTYFELEGKTTQATRSGKNLLTFNGLNGGTGLSVTYSYDNSIIKLNGTTSGGGNIISNVNTSVTLPTGSYTCFCYKLSGSYTIPTGSGQDTAIYLRDTNNTQIISMTLQNQTFPIRRTFTLSEAKTIRLQVYANSNNQQFNNLELGLQIESGTITSSDFEQYGIMPSPDYPSKLISVGYENLFEPTLQTDGGNISLSHGTGVVNEDTFTFTATGADLYFGQIVNSGASWARWAGTLMDVTNANQIYYYVSNPLFTKNYMVWYNENKVSMGYMTLTVSEGILTPPANTKYVSFRFGYANSVNGESYDVKVMIAKSVNKIGYVPYGKYGIEVKTTGKNLFDKNNSIVEGQYITGTNTIGTDATLFYQNYFIKVKPNTNYIISSSISTIYRIAEYKNDYTFIQRYYNANASTSYTFTTSANCQYIKMAGTALTAKDTLQIEEGATPTTYEYTANTYQYILDAPPRNIRDVKDLLYIKNGMLYVERKIGSVVLDGNTYKMNSKSSTTANNLFTSNALPNLKPVPTNSILGNIASSHFTNQIVNHMFSYNIVGIGVRQESEGLISIAFGKDSTINTVSLVNDWLANYLPTVIYELAEPYTEVLGQVDMPSTYEGITYIDISSNIDTNTYIQYRQEKTQVEAILSETNQFDIDSLKTGKILGNPAIDSYDLIQITVGNKIFKTLATNDLVYTGVLINTFDTQIGEEAKEQNVFVNGEETFKKWARTTIDNVEGSINLQAGQINETNGRINETNLTIDSQGALLNVIANNSNIDIEYDGDTPISGEIREVTTTTGFTFNAEGMTISDSSSNFYALHRNTGTYYYDGAIEPSKIVGQYTKDGSKQKDLVLFGVYYYGMEQITDTPMFVTQLYNDENGEECVGHFYNRGD